MITMEEITWVYIKKDGKTIITLDSRKKIRKTVNPRLSDDDILEALAEDNLIADEVVVERD
jgi:hypothetical protein